VPFPYVTVGGTPVHIYDGAEVDIDECFDPQESLAVSHQQILLEDWVAQDGNGICQSAFGLDAATFDGTCTIAVDVTFPESGQLYVNVHLDHGRKGPHVDLVDNATGLIGPDTLPDRYEPGLDDWGFDANVALNASIHSIDNCTTYTFSHGDGMTELGTDSVQNINDFKKLTGVMFMAYNAGNGDPQLMDADVELILDSSGEIVKTSVVDVDGFSPVEWKHTGKRKPYTLVVTGEEVLVIPVMLKGNGWSYVTYHPDTGEIIIEDGPGGGGGGGGGNGGGGNGNGNGNSGLGD